MVIWTIYYTLKIKTILKIAPASFKLANRIYDCRRILKIAPDLENRSRKLNCSMSELVRKASNRKRAIDNFDASVAISTCISTRTTIKRIRR